MALVYVVKLMFQIELKIREASAQTKNTDDLESLRGKNYPNQRLFQIVYKSQSFRKEGKSLLWLVTVTNVLQWKKAESH